MLFQLFMTGLFSLSHFSSPVYYVAMVPLLAYTVYWTISMMRDFGPLSTYTALSSICEVQRGEGGVVRDQGGMTYVSHPPLSADSVRELPARSKLTGKEPQPQAVRDE